MHANIFRNFLTASLICLAIPSAWPSKPELNFVAKSAVRVSQFPAPPLEDSPEAREDLEQVLAYQNARTTEQCARARSEVNLSLAAIFGPPYGPLSNEEVQAGRPFYKKLFADTDYFVNAIKWRWKRPRPFQRSRAVTPCIPPHDSFSYPSGHAAISRIAALAFSEIYPDKAESLMRRADDVALDRVIGGVHHPRDIEAGQNLADQLWVSLKQSPNFIRAVEQAKR